MDTIIKASLANEKQITKTNDETSPDEVLKNNLIGGIPVSQLDENKDGIYDFNEWKDELARMGVSLPENFQLTPGIQNFKEHGAPISCFDRNSDGYLNQEDMKNSIKAGGEPDLSGDGIFDYKDTVQGLKRYGINITPEQEEKIKQRVQEVFGSGISINEVMNSIRTN